MWGFIRDAILFVPTLLAATVLVTAILTTQGIAFLMGAILDWVISPGFVSLSYTRPCPSSLPNCNPIIGMGLNITQSFVNMILVLILVYVALSFALRIGETDAKKIFYKLILIALLVNFAPVFTGLIVDATNITMNYFLEPIKGGVSGVLTQIGPFVSSVIRSIWGAGGEISSRMGLLGLAGAQIFLNLAIAFAFFLFAGLFIFRYIAIWVLVILSPLAFAFWILPQTKRLWDMWWNNFLQWSIIGIPISFFLYLAIGSYSAISDKFRADLTVPEIESATVGIFNQLFPFYVIVIFLVLGFVIGLSTAAMGASTVLAATKTGGKWMGRQAGRGTGEAFRRLTKGKGPEWMQKQAAARLPGFAGKSVGGKILTAAGYATGATFARWAAQRGVGELGLRMSESASARTKDAVSKYTGTSAERKTAGMRDPRFEPTERIGALLRGIEESQLDGIKKGLGSSAEQEIIKTGKAALTEGLFDEFKKIRDAFPHLAEGMGKGFSDAIRDKIGLAIQDNPKLTGEAKKELDRKRGEEREKYSVPEGTDENEALKIISTMKIVSKMKPAAMAHMDKSALDDENVQVEIHHSGTGAHINQLAQSFGKEFIDDFQKRADALGSDFYEANNPSLAKYLDSSAAQGLGLSKPSPRPRSEEHEGGAGI